MKRNKYRSNKRKYELEKVLKENPKAKLTENQYKAVRATLINLYPTIAGKEITPETLLFLCEEIPAIQREWRRHTEGLQKDVKQRLSQQEQLRQGYALNYENDIKKLNTL